MRERQLNEWFLRLSLQEKKELYKNSKVINRLKQGYSVLLEHHRKIVKDICKANYELSEELKKK